MKCADCPDLVDGTAIAGRRCCLRERPFLQVIDTVARPSPPRPNRAARRRHDAEQRKARR